MSGRGSIALIVIAGTAAVGALLYVAFAPVEVFAPTKGELDQRGENEKATKRSRTIPRAVPASGPNTARNVSRQAEKRSVRWTVAEDWYAKLPAADRALGKRIQDAQDAGARGAVFAAAQDALKSSSAEVRQAAVDALSLQDGAEAVPLLAKFLSDPDESIASSAYFAWDSAVDGLESDSQKLDAVKIALTATKSEEHIKSAVSKLEMFDQARAIRELAELARDGKGPIATAAKASYETVTGEPFTDWATARLKAISAEHDAAE